MSKVMERFTQETRDITEKFVGMEAVFERSPGEFLKGRVLFYRTGDVNFIRISVGDTVYLSDPRKVYIKAENAA